MYRKLKTQTRDVTKLVKICRMRMRIVAFILSVGMCCTALGQLNDCYNMLFPKSIKSVFLAVLCNKSLSKNCVAHPYVTVVCVIG